MRHPDKLQSEYTSRHLKIKIKNGVKENTLKGCSQYDTINNVRHPGKLQ
jgi:hypothetical protein